MIDIPSNAVHIIVDATAPIPNGTEKQCPASSSGLRFRPAINNMVKRLAGNLKCFIHRYVIVAKSAQAGVWFCRLHEGDLMETFWDWLTVLCFGGLVVLMLQRSTEEEPKDELIQYLVPSVGCAVANYIGNNYSDVGAAAVLLVVAAYVFKVLKFPPIGPNRPDEQDGR